MKYLKYFIFILVIGIFSISLGSCKRGAEKYLEFELNGAGDGYLVKGYKEKKIKEEVVIPNVYDDLPVVGIKKGAFKDCQNINYVYIPSSVITIGEYAFANCGNLLEVELCEGLKYIETYAFEDCVKIKEMIFPNTIEYFGSAILSGAKSITKITTPYIGEMKTSNYDKATLGHFFGNHNKKDCNEITHYFGENLESNFFIPILLEEIIVTSNSKIAYGAFSNCTSISTVKLEKVSTIDKKAFSGCINLRNITFGSELYNINSWAFENCVKLKEVFIPKNVSFLEESSFEKCLGLEKIVFEDGSNKMVISDKSFYGCINLKNVVLGEGITQIGKYAFTGCVALNQINLVSTLVKIADYAFMKTPLMECDFSKATSLEEIGTFSFAQTNLKNVVLGSNVKILGQGSFAKSSIENIDFSKTQLKVIPEITVAECEKLTKVILPEGLEKINTRAFEKCINLKTINIPSSVNELSIKSFVGCTNLEYTKTSEGYYLLGSWLMGMDENISILKLPTYITGIASFAFEGNTSLKQVILSNSLLYIGDNAFNSCISLESVSFGNKLQSIGNLAFANCSLLREFHLPNTVTYIGDEILFGINHLQSLNIPYIPTHNGKGHIGLMFGIEEYTLQGQVLKNLSTITITNTSSIGDYAFYGLNSLKNIILCDQIESFGQYSFSELDGITNIVLPLSLKEIKDYAFFNTANMSEIYLAKSIEKIGAFAFAGCGELVLNIEYDERPITWNELFTTSTKINWGIK